ncbi:MAG: VWA domain-containing protein [Ilumatobacter sp.]|nr:VWA domain-containing protein [Ilumatobacter sp.]
MTLPELLIAMTVLGIIATVLAAAVVVTLRQVDSTEGRVNVARAEQSIGTWLPSDLASTDVGDTTLPAVDLDPAATPCGNCGGIDLSGANALQLAWKTTVAGPPATEVITRVQYQYVQAGGEWQIQRIECEGANPCTKITVLHDLDPPADPATFDPDTDRPVWAMDVAAPTDPAALDLSDNARRIVVTVDGGGGSAERGGGLNTINLTAGGIATSDIAPDEFTVPSFVRARSRCGGPVTLVIDDSGSIGQSNVDNVIRPGAEAFVEAFRGTPTQLQIVKFSSRADAIGPVTTDPTGWHRYADMTDDAQVDALKSSLSILTASGGTNWEEAFFHTFKRSDGTNASTIPNRVVFFTDGIPTRNRTSKQHNWDSSYRNGDAFIHYNDGHYDSSWPLDDGSSFHQESFDRADVILDQHRGTDLIFVGVGSGLTSNRSWIHNPAVYGDRTAPPAAATSKTGSEILAHLLANGPSGEVPAIYDSGAGEYTNPETADFYLQSNFDPTAFAAAMKAAALKDCGGTLTVQTKKTDGSPVADEFVYENVEYRDDTGTVIPSEPRRVTTSPVFRTGTFDFEISAGTPYFSVDVVPQELETLSSYTFVGWSCRAGATAKAVTPIPIDASSWEGFTVDVAANEAVSCVLEVS